MIDKMYYYFLKTKYLEPTTKDLEKLKEIHFKLKKSGLSADILSGIKKTAIEVGVLGNELSEKFRHVDNSILSTPFIIEAFLEDELSSYKRMKRLAPKDDPNMELDYLSESVDEIRQDIVKGMTPKGIEKAMAMGLL